MDAGSRRLQLEVDLLTAGAALPSNDGARAAHDGSRIVIDIADADIRDYIAQCMRGHASVQIVEIQSADDVFAVARSLVADLLITDRLAIATRPTQLGDIPVLVTGVDLPEELSRIEGGRIGVLPQPFNARRLLEAVGRSLADR